jgi:hypothetical protein
MITKFVPSKIKKSLMCKDIIDFEVNDVIPADYSPMPGDVIIVEVLKIGKHKRLQSVYNRNMTILPGDQLMVVFGNRYATAQFEGYVPDKIEEELDVLGAGGVIGKLKSMHDQFQLTGSTKVKPVGMVVNDDGRIINTKEKKKSSLSIFGGKPFGNSKIILSVGSSMDSGKSTTASYIVHGLQKAGLKSGFIKLTGTAFSKDVDLNIDMGADAAADFSDFGFPSTFMCEEKELLDLYESLVGKLNLTNKMDYIVVEIADGLLQRETRMLIENKGFMSTIDGVIFSAGDSLSAICGVQLLESAGIKPFALCGLFTASPLLIEEVRLYHRINIPIVTLQDLTNNITGLLSKK